MLALDVHLHRENADLGIVPSDHQMYTWCEEDQDLEMDFIFQFKVVML